MKSRGHAAGQTEVALAVSKGGSSSSASVAQWAVSTVRRHGQQVSFCGSGAWAWPNITST